MLIKKHTMEAKSTSHFSEYTSQEYLWIQSCWKALDFPHSLQLLRQNILSRCTFTCTLLPSHHSDPPPPIFIWGMTRLWLNTRSTSVTFTVIATVGWEGTCDWMSAISWLLIVSLCGSTRFHTKIVVSVLPLFPHLGLHVTLPQGWVRASLVHAIILLLQVVRV